MKFQLAITSLLLGAGAGVALARPSHHTLHVRTTTHHKSSSSKSSSSQHDDNTSPTNDTSPASSTGKPNSTGRPSSGGHSGSTGGGSISSHHSPEVVEVPASAGCTFTDAEAFKNGKTGCKSIILDSITVPAGTTLDGTGLADGTTITFHGSTTFGYTQWDGPLVWFTGKNIVIQGSDDHVIDMNGHLWWDGQGGNGGKRKPKGFFAHELISSTIVGLNIKNTPVQCFSINEVQDLEVKDVFIDNTAGDAHGPGGISLGHNTDAFDIGSSTGVSISNCTVYNQDDCMALNSGSNIAFTNNTCIGGHGISIGSVGGRRNNQVEHVYIANNTVSKSDNGVRIKTVAGASGSVFNVTMNDIKLDQIARYGIVIEQDYQNGAPTGKPTDGVPIKGVTLENISGSVNQDAKAVYILCASCSDWSANGVSVDGGSKDCTGAPSTDGGLC
ncbi:Glycosyl hydrolases family 28 [Teratosphaeria destructans]|uniref:endo-polygalacturonase n=1 Tax=Teratosphaeria destructans TaxID=418781 RepID=A0A9W7SV17_9PEZI|nr:Glycosyl hydrolases family 28 [Teratosphaeria destructans]